MSNRIINIKNYKKATQELERMQNKNYGQSEIKIINLHLRLLNNYIGHPIFLKNDAFVNAETLWAIMQEVKGSNKQHHYHSLPSLLIWKALVSLKNPYCILKTKQNRYTILSSFEDNGIRLLTIIEVNAPLKEDKKAKINKIVTIYPKDRINAFLKGKTILYIK